MSDLKQKSQELKHFLPKQAGGKAPEDTGIRLATFPRPEGVQKALDMALKEAKTPTARGEPREDRYTHSREGIGAEF